MLASRTTPAQSSSLEIVLNDEQGESYTGPATFGVNPSLPDGRTPWTGSTTFGRAPYRLIGLRAGNYAVTVFTPKPPEGLESATGSVSLAEGAREQVALIVRSN